jgi:cytochrome c-type biogenesis protein CcmH
VSRDSRISRRGWIAAASAAALSVVTAGRRATAQSQSPGLADTSNLFPMDQSAARSVRLPPKPGARPILTPSERDALEHRIRCQCGCTLDVYTCRTTDFSCQVSPAMHRDIMALVDGGHTAPEILEAFVNVYGERALMAPTREGFNLLAWVLPGTAVGVGALALAFLIRRWHQARLSPAAAAEAAAAARAPLDASPDEMARLEAAIRNDE